METVSIDPSGPRELPIVGGNLALNFANTVDDPLGPARHDHASTYPDLIEWIVRTGALDDVQASRLLRKAARNNQAAAASIAHAHELRGALNDIFGAVADDAPTVSKHWVRLRPFVADAYAGADLDDTDADVPRWTWTQTNDLGVVLHPIAATAAELLVGNDLRRIKRCAGCPWLFLDNSKNHSRRWCDMNYCGKAQKIERYVARRSARRNAG